jgi:hypothetical protein
MEEILSLAAKDDVGGRSCFWRPNRGRHFKICHFFKKFFCLLKSLQVGICNADLAFT